MIHSPIPFSSAYLSFASSLDNLFYSFLNCIIRLFHRNNKKQILIKLFIYNIP